MSKRKNSDEFSVRKNPRTTDSTGLAEDEPSEIIIAGKSTDDSSKQSSIEVKEGELSSTSASPKDSESAVGNVDSPTDTQSVPSEDAQTPDPDEIKNKSASSDSQIIKDCKIQDLNYEEEFQKIKPELKEKYEIEVGEKLGSGTFGRVYSATQGERRSEVVIKVQFNGSEAKNELATIDIIKGPEKHPNIVDYIGSYPIQKLIVICMEKCDKSLYEENLPMDEKVAKELFRGILAGVDYLHEKKIVHNDLKLQNILVHNQVAKIADLGSSEQFKRLSNDFSGTVVYFAPEVFKLTPYDPVKKDIYALGVVLHYLLTGRNPFDHDDHHSNDDQAEARLLENVMNATRNQKHCHNVSEKARNLIDGLLEVNVEKRMTLEEALDHPWMAKTE